MVPKPEPQGDRDALMADRIAETAVIVHLEPRTTPQPQTTLEPPAPASPFAAKIAYLHSLLATGNETALEEALRLGTLRVRVPGEAQTRVRRRAPSERPKTRKVFAPELVTQIRTLREAGHSYAQCEVLAGLKPDKGRTAWTIVNAYQGAEAE
jgi:hypothetical protein